MTQALTVPAKGSIQATGKNTALALLNAKMILICDRSGSMDTKDAMFGKKRYEIEDRVVAELQAKYPGQIVIEAFAGSAILCLDGNLPYPDGDGTIISNALELAAKLTKTGMRAVLITDGEATEDENNVLRAAQPLKGKLDIVYIGSDLGAGKSFLEKLADETAGTFQKNSLKNNPNLLGNTIEKLLLKAGGKK